MLSKQLGKRIIAADWLMTLPHPKKIHNWNSGFPETNITSAWTNLIHLQSHFSLIYPNYATHTLVSLQITIQCCLQNLVDHLVLKGPSKAI